MSYLSYVFNRKREPSLKSAERIASALRMGLEEFLLGLRGHVVVLKGGQRGGKQTKMRRMLEEESLLPKRKREIQPVRR